MFLRDRISFIYLRFIDDKVLTTSSISYWKNFKKTDFLVKKECKHPEIIQVATNDV